MFLSTYCSIAARFPWLTTSSIKRRTMVLLSGAFMVSSSLHQRRRHGQGASHHQAGYLAVDHGKKDQIQRLESPALVKVDGALVAGPHAQPTGLIPIRRGPRQRSGHQLR